MTKLPFLCAARFALIEETQWIDSADLPDGCCSARRTINPSATWCTPRTGETAATYYLGKPMFDWVNESARLIQLQNAAMSGGSTVARGDLLERYEFPDGEVVADIGWTAGSLLAELLADRPQRRGVLFDLPAVISDAPVRLSAPGLADLGDAVGDSSTRYLRFGSTVMQMDGCDSCFMWPDGVRR